MFSVSVQDGLSQSHAKLQKQLARLDKDFTYRGMAVHPRAIQDLCSWVADRLPGPIAIDVAGTFDSNRYFGDYKIQDNGNVFIDLTQHLLEDKGWFSYKHLGRLANGLHVIRTFDNGGGTGEFQSILLVQFRLDYEYEDNGKRRSVLVMRRRGQFGIGDRYNGKIKLDARRNRITVGPDKRNVDKAFTIKIGV